MKSLFIKSITGMVLLTTFLIIGCSQDMPSQVDSDPLALSKKPVSRLASELVSDGVAEGEYPQSGSGIASYWPNKNTYRGTGFILENGSSFDLSNGALTAPEYWPAAEDVTITMTIEKDVINNKLFFSFSPSGCSFDPPAEVWFSWQDIGIPVPNLYYINENGELIEEMPDNVFIDDKKMCLFIDHFSRYAVAYSD